VNTPIYSSKRLAQFSTINLTTLIFSIEAALDRCVVEKRDPDPALVLTLKRAQAEHATR
jgi:hypothetical protein